MHPVAGDRQQSAGHRVWGQIYKGKWEGRTEVCEYTSDIRAYLLFFPFSVGCLRFAFHVTLIVRAAFFLTRVDCCIFFLRDRRPKDSARTVRRGIPNKCKPQRYLRSYDQIGFVARCPGSKFQSTKQVFACPSTDGPGEPAHAAFFNCRSLTWDGSPANRVSSGSPVPAMRGDLSSVPF